MRRDMRQTILWMDNAIRQIFITFAWSWGIDISWLSKSSSRRLSFSNVVTLSRWRVVERFFHLTLQGNAKEWKKPRRSRGEWEKEMSEGQNSSEGNGNFHRRRQMRQWGSASALVANAVCSIASRISLPPPIGPYRSQSLSLDKALSRCSTPEKSSG